jgi:F0F1-type ATP synthase assembly protein I
MLSLTTFDSNIREYRYSRLLLVQTFASIAIAVYFGSNIREYHYRQLLLVQTLASITIADYFWLKHPRVSLSPTTFGSNIREYRHRRLLLVQTLASSFRRQILPN